MNTPEDTTPQRASLMDLAKYFTRLGFTAFGGPAAHIALMREDLVVQRRWIGAQHFADLLGAVQLVPGPNSTEMVIHIGYTHQRIKGMLVSGLGFILPAFFIVLALSIFYVAYGSLPQVSALLYGLQPVVVAIIVQAVYKLGLTSCRKPAMLGLAVAALLVTLLAGVNTVLVILGGGLIGMLLYRLPRRPGDLGCPAVQPAVRSLAPGRRLDIPDTPAIVLVFPDRRSHGNGQRLCADQLSF